MIFQLCIKEKYYLANLRIFKVNKFIKICKVESKTKTSVLKIIDKKTEKTLGVIKYYTGWQKYIFQPTSDFLWDSAALTDVIKSITMLTTTRLVRLFNEKEGNNYGLSQEANEGKKIFTA